MEEPPPLISLANGSVEDTNSMPGALANNNSQISKPQDSKKGGGEFEFGFTESDLEDSDDPEESDGEKDAPSKVAQGVDMFDFVDVRLFKSEDGEGTEIVEGLSKDEALAKQLKDEREAMGGSLKPTPTLEGHNGSSQQSIGERKRNIRVAAYPAKEYDIALLVASPLVVFQPGKDSEDVAASSHFLSKELRCALSTTCTLSPIQNCTYLGTPEARLPPLLVWWNRTQRK